MERLGKVVLLVEDDPEVRRATVSMIDGFGYDVIAAENGKAALEVLDGLHVDLLVADVAMPGSSDTDRLATEIRKRRPDIPILCTTGSQPPTRSGSPCDAFLVKPFASARLKQKLRALAKG